MFLCRLKPATQFDACLDGTSFLHEPVAHTLKVESGIILVQSIAHPEVYLPASLLKADAAVQSAVERLADGIFFCPVDASRTGIVDIQLDAVQPISRIDAEDVLSAYGQR